tara:strand:+ start:243 stop:521 length:279 start_codon:yes stop_codon:yes gene_type:complete
MQNAADSENVLAMLARIAELEGKNANLEAQAQSRPGLKMKVSKKGAVSIYGLQRFPVTLYREQWKRIDEELIQSGSLDQFIDDNRDELATKG